MTFHYIKFTTYCHATEDPSKVKEALINAAGREVEIEEELVKGHYGNTITIMRCELSKSVEYKTLFDDLPKELVESLLDTVEKRIDEDCNFYFRLDKASAYLEEPRLSDGNYVIKIRAKVETYPAKRKKALNNIKQFLNKCIEE